jgi:hypothetical protein
MVRVRAGRKVTALPWLAYSGISYSWPSQQ